MDASMASRDRSPLKYPGAASQSLNPTYTHSQAFDSTLDNSFTAHTSLDESYNQNLDQFQQQLGMNNTDPAYQDFQSSAQHFNLEPSDIAQALHTENFSNTSIIDPHQSPHHLSNGTSPAPDLTNTSFQSFNFDSNNLDPTLDPLIDTNLLQEQSAGIADPMSTGIAHTSTPPHLLPGMMRHSSGSPSPRASPGLPQQASFGGMTRPRNTSESLNPASAAFPQALGGAEWSNMGAYRHRRIASDNISELSSHSAHASPYLGNIDANPASPMLNPSDPSFGESFGMGDFSINDQQPGSNFHSPAHSPQPSPRLVPQQQLPVFTPENNFGLNESTMHGQFGQTNGFDAFSNQEPFPNLQQGLSPGSNELGQADHMSPPAINIDFVEPVRSSEGPPSGMGDLGLPPMPRRSRAKSDSYAGHRPGPGYIRGRSPSLQPENTPDLLFPSDGAVQSRSTSPRGRHGISSHQRTTSAASDQREYILDLANPERSPSNSGENRRSQKHPATFQCTLCPKRFTRAYNLRSHLRTHTDERPFVCTVCSKAFARQHDRKRHEGLHSGEKKFVCKGPLQSGQSWGCNRRFARADALGRHFRSEAGRICIKPLLDEEAAEQESKWNFQQQAQQQAGFLQQQPNLSTSLFPQAILQMYPALAGIDLTAAQGQQDDEYNGRSSFDASSGGEMGLGDELSDNDMNNGYHYQNQQSVGELNRNFALGMQQPSQQHMNNYGGYQMSDYTNGMEGR